MGMVKEFKEFAMRGNVVDMAVGIIIGGAFGKIVSSFVNDVIMPPIGLLLGNVDFSNLAITLKGKTAEAEAVTLKYGVFINTVLDCIRNGLHSFYRLRCFWCFIFYAWWNKFLVFFHLSVF